MKRKHHWPYFCHAPRVGQLSALEDGVVGDGVMEDDVVEDGVVEVSAKIVMG
jgi:hypothetical protein